jgi:hypothetical protein
MNIETLHTGMKVCHPQYGVGVVKSLTGQTAEIAFDHAQRTIAPTSSDLQPAEPPATLSELQMPLANLIRDTVHAVVEALGLEQKGRARRRSGDSMAARNAGTSHRPDPSVLFCHSGNSLHPWLHSHAGRAGVPGPDRRSLSDLL